MALSTQPQPPPAPRRYRAPRCCSGPAMRYSAIEFSWLATMPRSTIYYYVSPNVVGQAELEASKEGRALTNFKYACIGYSVYLDNEDSSADSKDKTAKLPFCIGLEMVLEEKSSTSPVGHVPAHKTEVGLLFTCNGASRKWYHDEEHEHATPQPRRYKPPSIIPEEFLNRFQRNASLVASGVVRNLNRGGHYVKETLVDILYRRPK